MEHPAVARSRRDRQAGPDRRRDRESVRRVEDGRFAGDEATRNRCSRTRASGSARRLRRARSSSWIVAENEERQDHAAAAEGARTRFAGRRYVDVGDVRHESRSFRATHALELLRAMVRIRRFEEKCAELYSAAEIRGFLHLYVGEEAIAVGMMRALVEPTTRSSRRIASTATRSRAASGWGR